MIRTKRRILITQVALLIAVAAMAADPSPAWRSGWIGGDANLTNTIACARALSFHALISHGKGEQLLAFSEAAAAAGLESYWWFSPVGPTSCIQRLRPDEEAAWKAQQADPKKMENGYQGGGEPLAGHVDYNWNPTVCFHRPEVREATRAAVKTVIEGNPRLTGIALDMFGYPNYRDCVCDESERQWAVFRQEHPELAETAARETFFRDTLVEFQNELCRYARQLRPTIKTTVHVWPTYLPEPVYGNRLDLDYACQTAAWFFHPYWSDETIAQHARLIVNDARLYHPRQTGVPFVGLFGDKPAERFEHELRVIFGSTPSRSLSIFNFGEIVNRSECQAAVRRVWAEFGVSPQAGTSVRQGEDTR